jgi:hypothetical protein
MEAKPLSFQMVPNNASLRVGKWILIFPSRV